MSAIRVSILTSSGRSSKFTSGRKMEDMELGRTLRTAFWGFMNDPSVVMMKVTKKPWWWMSQLASSTTGRRWPIPGLVTKTTWGSFYWVVSMVGLEVKDDGKHYVFMNYIYRLKCPNFFSLMLFLFFFFPIETYALKTWEHLCMHWVI